MSAWFMSKRDIDVLVSALVEFKVWLSLDGKNYGSVGEKIDPTATGKLLWLENARSVTDRYDLDTSESRDKQDEHADYVEAVLGYTFHQYHMLKPGPVAKLAACYEYQSCEHDEWETSVAKDIIARLNDRLVRFLPGYEGGPWGINTDDDLALICSPGAVSLSQLARRRK